MNKKYPRILAVIILSLIALNGFQPVRATATFDDVPQHYWAYEWIERLVNAGITAGCQAVPPLYCPENDVTRAQMAIFLERGKHGADFEPPHYTEASFTDVPFGSFAFDWIEKLKEDGITTGCQANPPQYCPESPVTRAQMAIFLMRMKYGASWTPPDLNEGTGFLDVPAEHWAAAWIKALAAQGITAGCGGGNYCPEQAVTRAQMAVFLVRTFDLPELEPTPQPTEDPAGVNILANHTAYIDDIEYLHIVGEIRNNTDNHLRQIEVQADIYNTNDQLISTTSGFTLLNTLASGEKTCFNLFLAQPEGWSYYQFKPLSYLSDGQPSPNLSLTNLTGRNGFYFDWGDILGEVTNNHNEIVKSVTVVGTLYSAAGDVLGCNAATIYSIDLGPAQTSGFHLYFLDHDYGEATQFRLQVGGDSP